MYSLGKSTKKARPANVKPVLIFLIFSKGIPGE